MKLAKLNSQQIAELEEILEMVKVTEQKAREMCELATKIAWKYQKQIGEGGVPKQDTPILNRSDCSQADS